MQPLKRSFRNHGNLPFVMSYLQQKKPEDELPDHIQEWFELVYVHDGEGTFFIDHQFYSMSAGNVFIIPANTIHRAILEPHLTITVTAIYWHSGFAMQEHWDESYHPAHIFQAAVQASSYKIELTMEQQMTMASYLERIHTELTEQALGYKSSSSLTLQLMLITLSRIRQQHKRLYHSSHSASPAWMKAMIQKLDQHDALFWNVGHIAKLANVSSAHFSRVFKQSTGINISQFLMMKRVIAAKQLLTTTDRKLSLIAEQCGFDSIPHFYRCFKKMTLHTPASYRNLHR